MLFTRISTPLRALLLVIVLTAGHGSLLAPETAAAENSEYRVPVYFDATGFWLQGPFREYWETNGGLYVFGMPITGIFLDDGMQKQYFERAIFEFHTENAGTEYEVLLQRLGAVRTVGRETEDPFEPVNVQPDANCDFYPETGHRLCFGFRTFWEANGGLSNFGYPISEEFTERNNSPPAGDGQEHTVQYFERTRFEYHPEYAGTQYEVLLGLLGTEYLAANGAPADALVPQPKDMPPGDPTSSVRYGPHVGYGFNLAWRGDEAGGPFHEQTLNAVNDAGFSWVRIQVTWRDVEVVRGQYHFAHIDRLVDMARGKNIRVLASIAKAPTWATENGTDGIPVDTAAFSAMMERLAQRFNGRINAYEIWNEQNLAFETGGTVDVGRYVNLLRAGYTAVKSKDASAVVLYGGMTPTGVDIPTLAVDDVLFLQRIYEYNGGEIKNYYDALGAHPGSNCNSPDGFWPGNPECEAGWNDHNSFYFRRIEELRRVMVENGEAHKQIWLTEFGWTTANPAPGYEYGQYNSEQDQADYLVRAYQIGKWEWPWVGVMFVWNLNFAVVVEPSDEKGPWSVLNPDWSPRPSYDALKNMPK